MKNFFILIIILFLLKTIKTEETYSSDDFDDYFAQPYAPIAARVELKPDYYSDGDGPQYDEEDNDNDGQQQQQEVIKQIENKTVLNITESSNDFDDYFAQPYAPIASRVELKPEYYVDGNGPIDEEDQNEDVITTTRQTTTTTTTTTSSSSPQHSDNFDDYFAQPYAPIASRVELKPDYYVDGDGPIDSDVDQVEDLITTTRQTTTTTSSPSFSSSLPHLSDDFEDYFSQPYAPIASKVELKPEYYVDGDGPINDYIDTEVDEPVVSSTTTTTTSTTTTQRYDGVDDELIDDEDKVSIELGGLTGFVGKLIKGPKKSEQVLLSSGTPEYVYQYMESLLEEEMNKALLNLLPKVYDYAFELDIEQNCQNSLAQIGQTLRAYTVWPFKFISSSALIPINIIDGTLMHFGNYQQCLNARAYGEDDHQNTIELFAGKYCLARARLPMHSKFNESSLKYSQTLFNFTRTKFENTILSHVLEYSHHLYSIPLTFALCVPSKCLSKDIQYLFNNVLQKYQISIEVEEQDCETKKENVWNDYNKTALISLAVLLVLLIVVIIATIYELYAYNSKTLNPIILCFSARSNANILFEMNDDDNNNGSEDNRLLCLNGIAVITMLWIVVSNVYLLGFQPQIKNIIRGIGTEMRERSDSLVSQLILNVWNASQIFFLISGVIIGNKLLSKKNISIFNEMISLYLHNIPSIISTILILFLFQFDLNNFGPIFKSNSHQLIEKCEQNWWQNILLINNFYKSDQICLPQTAFISIAFQLSLFGLAFILFEKQNQKFAKLLNLILIIIGLIIPAFIANYKKLSAINPLFNRPIIQGIGVDTRDTHFITFNHFSSFFIGIAISRELNENNTKQFMTNKVFKLLLWLLLASLTITVLLITSKWNNSWNVTHEPTLNQSMIYHALHRLLFVAFFAFVINECIHKRAGYINSYLSHKLFKPLNRLSKQIYLLNFIIVWFYYFTKTETIQFKHSELLITSFGIYMFSIFFSIITYLLIECPFNQLFNHFFNRKQQLIINEKIELNEQNKYNIKL